ncbi:MAG: PBP1A family penicillin-binding protein [Pseudomonadota bacterium]
MSFAPAISILRAVALGGLLCAYLVGMAGLVALARLSADLPDPSRLWEQNRPPSVQFIDRQGRDIAVRGAHALEPMPIAAVPHHVRKAVLATEDRRFHAHAGIDPYGLARAVRANWRAGRVVEGGSTLTQQLTKNVFLTPEQTLTRKAQEMIVAVWLERRFTKSELLRLYLSRVYFGGGAWGLEAASQTYFGRSPDEISLSEAALLAGLLKAPSALNPASNPDGAAARMRTVLRAMDRQGLLDDGVLAQALTAPVSVLRPRRSGTPDGFVDWIWPEVERRVGVPNRDMVIQVTLDAALQQVAQASVAARLDPARGAEQAALILLDGRGEVLALVGGADYGDSQFNRAVQAVRQPGSAFKPVVYLAAMEAGLKPWTMSTDSEVTVDGWTPRNFSPHFRGAISLEDALARSVNTVAVKLSEQVGRDRVVAMAERLGLAGLKPYASIALGAQGVGVLALTQAYLPFATAGEAWPAHGLLSIATADGTPLYDRDPGMPRRVLSPEAVRHMNRMLVGTVERGTGRRARVPGRQVAGKTGTTNDHRDAWFVGYAPDVALGVWVGNDANQPMRRVTGGTLPAEIFADVMGAALADRPAALLPQTAKPDGLVRRDRLNSLLDALEEATAAGQ